MTDPHAVDVHVGGRVRLRRMLLGMSQEKLGEALGLTFQQIQKYEKGANRISSSRLFQISEILGVSIMFFFEGLEDERPDEDPEGGLSAFSQLIATREGFRLVKAFSEIENKALKGDLVALIERLSKTPIATEA